MAWNQPRIAVQADTIRLAEELGYDSLWSAEAYGSDAFTPLAFAASLTRRIRLGTGIAQLAARTPAAAAMAIATLDQLAGDGRAILGLGVSGPQIVEGWYGQPWGRPYHRVKDYVAIVRAAASASRRRRRNDEGRVKDGSSSSGGDDNNSGHVVVGKAKRRP